MIVAYVTFGRGQRSAVTLTPFPPGTTDADKFDHFAFGPRTRPIRFWGRWYKQGLATGVGRGIRYIYFYWPARFSWCQFQVPLDISKFATYRMEETL